MKVAEDNDLPPTTEDYVGEEEEEEEPAVKELNEGQTPKKIKSKRDAAKEAAPRKNE